MTLDRLLSCVLGFQGPTPALLLRLRGASEQRDESAVARAALEERLAAAEKMAKVRVSWPRGIHVGLGGRGKGASGQGGPGLLAVCFRPGHTAGIETCWCPEPAAWPFDSAPPTQLPFRISQAAAACR